MARTVVTVDRTVGPTAVAICDSPSDSVSMASSVRIFNSDVGASFLFNFDRSGMERTPIIQKCDRHKAASEATALLMAFLSAQSEPVGIDTSMLTPYQNSADCPGF